MAHCVEEQSGVEKDYSKNKVMDELALSLVGLMQTSKCSNSIVGKSI